MSILGLINGADRRVRLPIGSDLPAAEYAGCHPCRNTSSLRIRITDLTEKILPALGHTATVVQL